MKYISFSILILLFSCSNTSESKVQKTENNEEIDDVVSLEEYVEYDSLGNLLAEGFLNKKGLFEGELTIYTQSVGRYEKLNMHNDTMIGYISEYYSNGTLKGYKNYLSTSIWEKGDINELLMYDSSANNYHEKSIYVDVKNCFENGTLLDVGRVKVMPTGTYKLKIRNLNMNSDTTTIDCKLIGEGEFEVNFSQLNINTGDTVKFIYSDVYLNSEGESRKGGGEVIKTMRKFHFFTPKLN